MSANTVQIGAEHNLALTFEIDHVEIAEGRHGSLHLRSTEFQEDVVRRAVELQRNRVGAHGRPIGDFTPHAKAPPDVTLIPMSGAMRLKSEHAVGLAYAPG